MFFFFKQKTAYEMCGRDWSSDVCSSDLNEMTTPKSFHDVKTPIENLAGFIVSSLPANCYIHYNRYIR